MDLLDILLNLEEEDGDNAADVGGRKDASADASVVAAKPAKRGGDVRAAPPKPGVRSAPGFAVAAKTASRAGASSRASGQPEPSRGLHAAERLSGIRLSAPAMGSLAIEERTTHFPFVRLEHVRRAKADTFQGCWSTIAAVVEKGLPREGAKGSRYLILKLGNLDSDDTHAVFLFGDAYQAHWRLHAGSIVLLQNAKARADASKAGNSAHSSGGPSFSIAQPDQLCVVGRARDYGICAGTRKDGSACTMPVNVSRCAYCKYHASMGLKKLRQSQSLVRPQMGGSNFYAHQAKELRRQQDRADGAIAAARDRRVAAKGVRALPPRALAAFADKQLDAKPHSRAAGAISKVAANRLAPPTHSRPSPPPVLSQPKPSSRRVALGGAPPGSKAAKENYARAVAFIASIGGLKAPDPNRTVDIGVARTGKKAMAAAKAADARMGGGGGAARAPPRGPGARPGVMEAKASKARGAEAAFLDAFAATRKRAKEEKGAPKRSLYASEAEEAAMAGALRRADALATKEELTTKLADTHCIKVTCFHCARCKRHSERKPTQCIQKGHAVSRRANVPKRFFVCAGCKRRCTTLAMRYPVDACERCGGVSWDRAGLTTAKAHAGGGDGGAGRRRRRQAQAARTRARLLLALPPIAGWKSGREGLICKSHARV